LVTRIREPIRRGRVPLLEVVAVIEVLDQSRVGRCPAEKLLGQRARCGVVKRDGPGEIVEVAGYILRRDADGWQIQVAADGLGDLAERHALA
jgi:hypothetical protein